MIKSKLNWIIIKCSVNFLSDWTIPTRLPSLFSHPYFLSLVHLSSLHFSHFVFLGDSISVIHTVNAYPITKRIFLMESVFVRFMWAVPFSYSSQIPLPPTHTLTCLPNGFPFVCAWQVGFKHCDTFAFAEKSHAACLIGLLPSFFFFINIFPFPSLTHCSVDSSIQAINSTKLLAAFSDPHSIHGFHATRLVFDCDFCKKV